MLLCAAPFGIIAICISQILYSQLAMYINTYYTRKLFGLSYLMQVKYFSKYLVYAVVACVPAYLMVLFDIEYDAYYGGDKLADDGGQCRARDLHAGEAQQSEDEDRVYSRVEQSARKLHVEDVLGFARTLQQPFKHRLNHRRK